MTPEDLERLRRCVELAKEATERGDHPFGSVLVSKDGRVLAERSNRVVTSGDVTAHPELHLAQWASLHLTPVERAGATMYTSGEHCAMCAAAQVWAGIGGLVYVLSAEQIRAVSSASPMIELTASEVIERSNASVSVSGPCEELSAEAARLFR